MIDIHPDTIRKIDFLVSGVEKGSFDESVKKIEFSDKLNGNEPLSIFGGLVNLVNNLEQENQILRDRTDHLETRIRDLEAYKSNTEMEMRTIAEAVAYLMNPNPLNHNLELSDIETWVRNKGVAF